MGDFRAGGGGGGRRLHLLAWQGGELIDFKRGPSSSSSPEMASIWDSVSQCYRQELLLNKVGLLSSSSFRPCCVLTPPPAFYSSPSLESRKKCPGRVLRRTALPESNF